MVGRFPSVPMRWCIGVDLGSLRDHTAITVNEKGVIAGTDMVCHSIRFAHRLPQGLPYPAIVHGICQIYDWLIRLPPLPQPPILAVDATGLGKPVTDLLVAQCLDPVPVTLTAASDWSHDGHGGIRLPKSVMVSTFNVALQEHRLRIASGIPILPVLRQELAGYRVRLKNTGAESFGNSAAFAQHDDLVISSCLSVFVAEVLSAPRLITRLL